MRTMLNDCKIAKCYILNDYKFILNNRIQFYLDFNWKDNMERGKQVCKILKDIRKQIAEENDIEFITSECKHQGDCAGMYIISEH